jgi:ABC-type nitrate/sulfonate/bicarbonate transport system ATPase subunit
MAGISKQERRIRSNMYLEQVGLSDSAHLLPHQLSGGMKQRTALARTLVTEPRLILMDEPFAALDAITRETLQTLLKDIWTRNRRTVLFITHDVDEALLLSTRIIVMSSSPGTIKEDMENPLHAGQQTFSSIRQSSQYAFLRERLVASLK